MPDINPSLPLVGSPNSSEEPKIVTALQAIIAAVNDIDSANILDGTIQAADIGANAVTAAKILDGEVTATKLATAILDALGVTAGATTRRGISSVAAEVTTASAGFVTLAGDSQISVTQPANGLTFLWASAEMHGDGVGASGDVGYQIDGTTNVNLLHGTQIAASYPGTPVMSLPGSGVGTTSRGAPVVLDVSGTHGYRLVYLSGGGTVAFKNRKLCVWTIGF